jgi:hypothetical protein
LTFEFVSDFEFRISNFSTVIRPLVGGEEEGAASEKGGKGVKVISDK